jgi:hypothetical protein
MVEWKIVFLDTVNQNEQPLKQRITFFLFCSLLLCESSQHLYSQETDHLRLNDVRILASHNSYKKKPDPKVLKFLSKVKNKIGPENDPIQLEYGHELLSTQLNDFNIRGFELDVYYDPLGGKFSKRKINSFVFGLRNKSKEVGLKSPGFKILHIADIDYETNYVTLESALAELGSWSQNNPTHCPIFVNIEVKATSPGDLSKILRNLGFKRATKFTENTFHLLDSIIESNFSTEQLFTPVDMKKNNTSLRATINNVGWPLFDDCRGKIFFVLEGDNIDLYKNKGERPLFVYGEKEDEDVIFLLRNDPLNNENEINALTDQYIVRTRSDAGTLEARKNDYTRFFAALTSNAQIISTDFYKADPTIGKFVIRLGEEFILRAP